MEYGNRYPAHLLAQQYRDMIIREDASMRLLNKQQKLTRVQRPVPALAPNSALPRLDARFGLGGGGPGLENGWQQTRVRKSAMPLASGDRTGSEWYPVKPVRVDFTIGRASRRDRRDGPDFTSWGERRGGN